MISAARSFRRVRLNNFPDARFHFELAVPAAYSSVPIESQAVPPRSAFFPVARFVNSQSLAAELRIDLATLPRELHAGDLAELDAEVQGEKVVERRDASGSDGFHSRLMTEFSWDGEPWVRRSQLIKDGVHVYRIDGLAAQSAFQEADAEFRPVLASFRLLSPGSQPCAEELVSCQDSRFRFDYPQSWTLTEIREDVGGAKVSVLTNLHRETLHGRITVEGHALGVESSPARCMRKFSDQLKADGVKLCGAPIVSVPAPSGFSGAQFYAPQARLGGRGLAVSALVLQHSELLLLLTLESVTKEVSPLAWAVNRRAFELVRDSLTVQCPP